MFGSNKNKTIPEDNNPMSATDPALVDAPKETNEVYIMPEKFHSQKPNSSSNKTLIIVSIILLAVIVVSGSWFIYDMWQKNQIESPPATNQNTTVVNTNTNTNTNANANGNNNGNDNTNTNTNTNGNDNTNTNNNGNDNTNGNQNNNNANSDFVPIVGGDADRDGLTDLEEGIIGSSASSPDSDQDGYLDGQELVNNYNPIVSSYSGNPFMLVDAEFVDVLVTNFTSDNFSTLYIKGWSVSLIDALHEARIITGTGEMIKISITDNVDGISPANWYLINHPNIVLSQLDTIEFGDFKGVYSPNKLAVYLTDTSRDKFYIFEYDLDNRAEFRYPTLFYMIIKNFELVDSIDDPFPVPTSTDPTI
ncbi:MAG: hypothetical protein ABH884_02860 [Candidatus Komeilibacteria bacterium]